MISTKASAVNAPTPGCVISRCAEGHCSASCSMAWLNSAIVGFSRSSNSNRSCRRRSAHGANRNASSCCRPRSRHNFFLHSRPSFSATACSGFMTRVRACTIRCRCHNSCRRSRFSQLGTQIGGKSSFSNKPRICCASCRSVFCLRPRLRRISAASPILNSNFNSASSRSNQRACPLASIPTRTCHRQPPSYGRTSPLPLGEPVSPLAVLRFLYRQKHFVESSDGNHTYNEHVGLFLRAGWLALHHQPYSDLGADIVMESITLKTYSGN